MISLGHHLCIPNSLQQQATDSSVLAEMACCAAVTAWSQCCLVCRACSDGLPDYDQLCASGPSHLPAAPCRRCSTQPASPHRYHIILCYFLSVDLCGEQLRWTRAPPLFGALRFLKEELLLYHKVHFWFLSMSLYSERLLGPCTTFQQLLLVVL